jgi:hypothetical protein
VASRAQQDYEQVTRRCPRERTAAEAPRGRSIRLPARIGFAVAVEVRADLPLLLIGPPSHWHHAWTVSSKQPLW